MVDEQDLPGIVHSLNAQPKNVKPCPCGVHGQIEMNGVDTFGNFGCLEMGAKDTTAYLDGVAKEKIKVESSVTAPHQ